MSFVGVQVPHGLPARLDPGNPSMSPEVLDRFGRCAVCGRREDCCEECHRGHDWAWRHPQWSIEGSGQRVIPARALANAFLSEVDLEPT